MKKFFVIGNPIEHSLSPILHNYWIKINGIDLYKSPEKLEGVIGFVPQDDLLIEELTVFENLFYNAKLCFGNYEDQWES